MTTVRLCMPCGHVMKIEWSEADVDIRTGAMLESINHQRVWCMRVESLMRRLAPPDVAAFLKAT